MNSVSRILSFPRDILRSRKLILELSKKDLHVRYLGSYLGFLWAFIQPIVSILIYWFVFQVGFKSTPVNNVPFILWFIPANLAWNFFSDALINATNSIVDNSYLVKKVVFPVSVLPIIKIMSSLFIHLFFIVFMVVMFSVYGFRLSVYNLQVLYYLAATMLFLLGLSWITSSLIIFLKDVGQFITMALQFGFWLTPIFWSISTAPHKLRLLVKLNPMYYIVQGYRNSFIYHRWFWQDVHVTVYFWIVTCLLLGIGSLLISKLRPHFADVL